MKNRILFIFMVIVSISQSPAEGRTFRYSYAPKYISNYVEKNVQDIDKALMESMEAEDDQKDWPIPLKVNHGESRNESWYFSRFKIRIAPYVEFEIGIAELKIFPIVEFDWVKSPPAGWREYHP